MYTSLELNECVGNFLPCSTPTVGILYKITIQRRATEGDAGLLAIPHPDDQAA
jgi:hypothetical protein